MTKDSGVNGVIIPEMYCVFLLVAHPTWTKICREAGDGGGGVEEAGVNMGKLSVFFFSFVSWSLLVSQALFLVQALCRDKTEPHIKAYVTNVLSLQTSFSHFNLWLTGGQSDVSLL